MSSVDEKTKDDSPVSQQPSVPTSTSSSPPRGASGSWALGLAVAVIGGLLLAKNLGVNLFFLDFHNWWAFFILLAAIGPLQLAYRCYQREGFGAATLNALVTAGSIIFIALIFLLDLSFGTWWPVFIIIGGLYMMTSRNP